MSFKKLKARLSIGARLKRIYLNGSLVALGALCSACAWADSTDDALSTLSTKLGSLGLSIYNIVKGPYAAIAVFVLLVVTGSKMGQTALSSIIMAVVGGAVFYAFAPELIWSIFGSGAVK